MPYTGWPDEVTPRDLARALDITEKRMRAWLRAHPTVIHPDQARWLLTPAEADTVVAAYNADT